MTKHTALYCRSARKNDEQINEQIQQLNKYCAEDSITNFNLYTDNSASEFSRSRPAFDELLKDIGDGKIDKLIATSLERISRDVKYIEYRFNSYILKHNVEIVTLSGNFR